MNELTLAILQDLILMLIKVLFPVALIWVLRRFVALREEAEGREWWDTVERLAREAAHAAEQLGTDDRLAEYYGDKKTAAIHILERWLAARSIPLDVDPYWEEIEDIIEAEVDRINAREGE